MSRRSKFHKFVVYEQKCKKWQNHAPDYDGCNHAPRWRQILKLQGYASSMSRGIRDFGIVGPTGPKGPTYCQGGKPLMEEGKPRDDYYDCVWIDKQGRIQQRTDATGAICVDTAYGDGNDGK